MKLLLPASGPDHPVHIAGDYVFCHTFTSTVMLVSQPKVSTTFTQAV